MSTSTTDEPKTGPASPSTSPLPTLTLFEGVTNVLLFSSVGFLLGVLFVALGTTEYGLLYTNGPTTPEAYQAAEQAYLSIWTCPEVIIAIFHLVLFTPIVTLSVKLARYTEAAIYFDGLCLAMILLVLGLYTGSTIPNLRKLAFSPSTETLRLLVSNHSASHQDPTTHFNRLLILLSNPSKILLKPDKALQQHLEFVESLRLNPVDHPARCQLLKITAAGHSIAIFLLVGVLFLQIGKVYAEIEDAKLKSNFAKSYVTITHERKEQR